MVLHNGVGQVVFSDAFIIFGVTIGNSPPTWTMVDMLRHNLVQKTVLPVEERLLHNRCAAYVTNLIANDGPVDSIVGKIRKYQVYPLKKIPKTNFEKIIVQEGLSYDQCLSVLLDIPTS